MTHLKFTWRDNLSPLINSLASSALRGRSLTIPLLTITFTGAQNQLNMVTAGVKNPHGYTKANPLKAEAERRTWSEVIRRAGWSLSGAESP